MVWPKRLIFGGVVMPEDAGADNSGFQRSIFRHAAAKKQMWNSPMTRAL